MKGKATKKHLAGHIVCIFLTVLCTAAVWHLTLSRQDDEIPSYYYEDLRVPEETTLVYRVVNGKTEKNSIGKLRKDEKIKDEQLFLDFREGKDQSFHSVIVKLAESYPYDMECTLYYENRRGNYDWNCKTSFVLPKGEKTVFFSMPENRYYPMGGIRVDFEEEYRLEEVLLSDQDFVGAYRLADHLTERSAGIYFLAILGFLEFLRFFWPEILYFFAQIWEMPQDLKLRHVLFSFLGLWAAANGAIGVNLFFQSRGQEGSWFWTAFASAFAVLTVAELYKLFHRLEDREEASIPLRQDGVLDREALAARILFWMGACALIVLVIQAWRDCLWEIPAELDPSYVMVPFAALLVQILLLALLFRKYVLVRRMSYVAWRKSYMLILLLAGLAFLFLFLPYVAPDETDHYLSAYRVSDLLLGQIGQLGDKRLMMRMEDYRFYAQSKKELGPVYYLQIAQNLHPFLQEKGMVIAGGPMVTNAVFSYIPAGAGIALARLLHLSSDMTFYAGRLANLVFFLLVFRALMRKLPFGETALFALAMFPMMLHTVGSYSYDGPTFCIAALFAAQVMQMACREGRIRRQEYLLCVLYAVLLGPSKLVYFPLLLMVFLIPSEKFSESRRKAFRKKCAVVFWGLAFTVLIMGAVNLLGADSAIRKMVQDSAGDAAHIVKWAHEEGYTISWILMHPLKYLVMCVRTVAKMADYYFFTMVGTKLGWLGVELPHTAASVSFFVFCLSANIRERGETEKEYCIGCGKKLFIAILCAGTVMITFLAMALDWTPLSRNYIMGVQGRYFLPLLVPAIWILRTPVVRVGTSIRKAVLFYEGAMAVLLLVHIFTHYMV